jgi:hypothetical protein
MNRKIAISIILLLLLGGGMLVIQFFVGKDDVKGDKKNIEEVKIETQVTTTNRFKGDMDADGIGDVKEKELGTSDFQFDTDGDGLSDNQEINKWKTDPLKTDSDGDGFSDGYEVLNGYDPAGPGKIK